MGCANLLLIFNNKYYVKGTINKNNLKIINIKKSDRVKTKIFFFQRRF